MANVAFLKDVYGDNHEIIYVKVPASTTLDDGNLVVADTLSTVSDEGDVYTATQATANTADNLAIIVGEEYYQDDEGNRINITDPTKIDYSAGQIVRAIRPSVGRKFAISNDALASGSVTVGQYVIPTANSYELTPAASIPADVKFALKVEFAGTISFRGNRKIAGFIGRMVTDLAEQ